MYILLAILAFGVLIAVHELGHFAVAKACNVRVNEFSVGMGPALLKKQGKETLYSLRLLPLGGYCAMEGEDEDSPDPRAFTAKPAWQRALILCAGAAMNFLIGFLFVLLIAHNGYFIEPVIADFFEGCPYESAEGFQVGDRIVRVDGYRTFFYEDVIKGLARSSGETHRIVLERDGKRVVLEDYPLQPVEYRLEDGSTVMKYGLQFAPRQYGFGQDVKYAWYEALSFVRLVWKSLGDLVTGAVGLRELSGPVGIVDYVNDMEAQAETPMEASFNFFYFFALIAVNLAVMNLLPLPALDGGRVFALIVTAVLERLIGHKLNPRYEGYIHTAGFVLLMALMVFVMFNDVYKIIFNR